MRLAKHIEHDISILLFYADDLAIAAKAPKEICDILPEKVNLK